MAQAAPQQTATPPVVVIADDSAIVRHTLSAVLGRLGIQVVETEDGVQALEAIRRHRPNLVILDVYMPHMDGLEVLRALRGQESLRSLPVFLLTSSTQASSIDMAADLRADGYLLKTELSPVDLRRRVGRYLGIQQLPRDWDPELSSKTILLALGQQTDTAAVARALATWGCGVIPTDDGDEAAELVAEGNQDAIVIDAALRTSAGPSVLSMIAGHFQAPAVRVPVLLLTGSDAATREPPVSAVLRLPLNEGEFHRLLRLQLASHPRVQPFDPARLMEVADGNTELARDMVETFARDAPPALASLETAARQGDTEAVTREAHGLKGMLELVGVNPEGDLYRRIEDLAADGSTATADLDHLRGALQQLIGALQRSH